MLASNYQLYSLAKSSSRAFVDGSMSGNFVFPRLEGLRTYNSHEEVLKSLDSSNPIQQVIFTRSTGGIATGNHSCQGKITDTALQPADTSHPYWLQVNHPKFGHSLIQILFQRGGDHIDTTYHQRPIFPCFKLFQYQNFPSGGL